VDRILSNRLCVFHHAYAVTYSVTYIETGSTKAAQSAGLSAALFMGIGGLRGGKIGANGDGATNDCLSSGVANPRIS
jgi:hypothetical protein